MFNTELLEYGGKKPFSVLMEMQDDDYEKTVRTYRISWDVFIEMVSNALAEERKSELEKRFESHIHPCNNGWTQSPDKEKERGDKC